MTISELRCSDKQMLTPGDIAPILGSDPQSIRCQAHADAARLGFPVIIVKRRVKIPRQTFLRYIGEGGAT